MHCENLIPLWDADFLQYQIGFASETYWKKVHEEKGEEVVDPPPFQIVEKMVEDRIANTHAILETKQQPIMFFTGKKNFRNEISTTGYKLRSGNKPYHHGNIGAYLKGRFEWEVQEGLEADDLLAIRQTQEKDKTIIITADKDLLQVPGWHYSYEYGSRGSIGPLFVEGFGHIEVNKGKIFGWGHKFFYSQIITGDRVDSIVGLPKAGPVKALKILEGANDDATAYKLVLEAYKAFYGDEAEDKVLENGRLLWMTRELSNGSPILWEKP